MKYFFLVFSISLLLISCKQEVNPCEDRAVIIGQDLRLCACCGGMFVQIDTTTYRVFAASEDSMLTNLNGLSAGDSIFLTWEAGPSCLGDEITITCFEPIP